MPSLFIAILFIASALLVGKNWGGVAHWLAMTAALIGGVFLFASPARGWWGSIAGWASWTWWIAFFAMLAVLAIIGFDVLRDRRPDRTAAVATFLLPILFVAGMQVTPRAAQEIGAAFHSWGSSVSSTSRAGR